jgi:hypothetical protein
MKEDKKNKPNPPDGLKAIERMISLQRILEGKSKVPVIPKRKRVIPPGYVRCEVCGEYNGSTAWENLAWGGFDYFEPGHMVSVKCICHGKLCPKCGVNRLRVPGSNSYEPETNEIGHWPGMIAMFSWCGDCRRKKQEEDEAKRKRAAAALKEKAENE